MAIFLDAAERANVDNVLRLPGLNFPATGGRLVIDKNNTDLMVALGAIDTKRARAGSQITVIRRLAFLYQTVLLIHKENPKLDINSDRFYAAALLTVAEQYHDVYKNLTPQSFRHVIELYRKAFARSGLKVISKSTEIQDTMDDRSKLEELVKEWMIARGAARKASTTEKKQVFHLFQDVNFPQQKPNETLDGYMLRLKHEFNKLNEDQQAVSKIMSYVSDQKGERVAQLSEQNREYENLLNKRLQLLDKKDDQIDGYERVLEQSRERLDKKDDVIRHYQDLAEQRRKRIDHYLDEINDFKIRITSMQQVIDQYGDMLDNHEDLVSAHAELDENLTEATKMQAEIMRLEINAAQRQDYVNYKLDEVAKAHNEIGEIQNELSQEVQRTVLMQGSVADRQEEIIRRQAQIMSRQMDVMDSVRAMLNNYNQG